MELYRNEVTSKKSLPKTLFSPPLRRDAPLTAEKPHGKSQRTDYLLFVRLWGYQNFLDTGNTSTLTSILLLMLPGNSSCLQYLHPFQMECISSCVISTQFSIV